MTLLTLPISDEAAKACVIAADRFGVEPWELAVHALWMRDNYDRLLGDGLRGKRLALKDGDTA